MTLEQLLHEKRDEIRRIATAHGAYNIRVFGSVARNQARKNSDVDILVDFEKPIGLFEYARLKLYLEEMLGRQVDLVTPEALRKELREDILREAIRAA